MDHTSTQDNEKGPVMNSIENQIAETLDRHAQDTPIEDTLESILAGYHIVRIPTDQRTTTRSRRPLLQVAAATILVVAGAIGVTRMSGNGDLGTASRSDGEPQPDASAVPVAVFPVLGPVPDLGVEVGGTFVSYTDPHVTSMVLGRRSGGQLVDAVTIHAVFAGSDDEGELVPPDAEVTNGTLGDLAVEIYENAWGRWYRWDDNGITVLVQDSTGINAISEHLSTSVDPQTGLVTMSLSQLPDGLEVIAVPQAAVGHQPGVSSDDGRLDLYFSPALQLVSDRALDRFDIVDINGREGFAASLDEGSFVTWRHGAAWMRLSSSVISVERLVAIAQDVTYTIRSLWEGLYNTSFPTPETPASTATTQP